MWTKFKDVIFHQVSKRGAAAAAASAVALLSKPEAVALLEKAGITINQDKLSIAVVIGATWILTTLYHLYEHHADAGK